MIELGKKLNGRYQITGNIGSGGMANVFLAHDLILDRDVAVKVLRSDLQNDQTVIRQFQREALAATELVHPNIVSVYDVGEEDNMQHLAMEYVKGMNLKRCVQIHYPIPYETAVNVMQQILPVISLAHNHQVIHRDLKPQNVLIDNEGVVKITDFEIAIALSEISITQTNTMLGSVHYLSSEQVRGSMATKQSDIYALGITLYEMLTGSISFDDEFAVTIALKHFQDNPPSIKALDPNVPQALENVTLRAMAKEPADHYKSAEEMFDDLSTILSPARANEEKWQSHAMDNETKVITPLAADTPIPDSSKSIPLPKDEPRDETLPVEEEDLSDPRKRGQEKWWLILSVVLVVLGIGITVFPASGGREEVVVPDVSDLSEVFAGETFARAKLEVTTKTKEIADDKVEEGNVVKTDPVAGTTVKQKREVTLYISSGTKKIKLDDCSGKSYEDVEASLKELGFSADLTQKEEEFSSEVESGMIISQPSSEDTEVDPKTDTITFTVSKGPETVTPSSHMGESYETVRNRFVTQGFNINNVSAIYDHSDTAPPGSIISQDPASGEVVAEETYINFVVSQGTEPKLNDIPGYTKSETQSYLASIGAEHIGHETSEYSSMVDKGEVIRTVPGAGTTIIKGMVVNVIYFKGLDPVSSGSEKGPSDSFSSSSSSSSTSSSSKEEPSSAASSSDSASKGSKQVFNKIE